MLIQPEQLTKALADATRLRIVALLWWKKELCVCELMSAMSLDQPKISRHLAILRKSAVVKGRREGQWIHYRLDPGLPDWANDVIAALVAGSKGLTQFEQDLNSLTIACEPAGELTGS